MRDPYQLHTGVVVLRPWPFGPPLRGRAPHHDAGMAGAPFAQEHGRHSTPSASASVVDLASFSTLCFAL